MRLCRWKQSSWRMKMETFGSIMRLTFREDLVLRKMLRATLMPCNNRTQWIWRVPNKSITTRRKDKIWKKNLSNIKKKTRGKYIFSNFNIVSKINVWHVSLGLWMTTTLKSRMISVYLRCKRLSKTSRMEWMMMLSNWMRYCSAWDRTLLPLISKNFWRDKITSINHLTGRESPEKFIPPYRIASRNIYLSRVLKKQAN